MKKDAVCGAAAPKMRRMLFGALMNSWIWFKKDPATNVPKKIVTTCRMQATSLLLIIVQL